MHNSYNHDESLVRRYAQVLPFNYASFLLIVSVIVLVRVSYFLYFSYRSAIHTAIPTLVGLLSLRLSTPILPFSFSTLYHSSPVYAVAVCLLHCPPRDWSLRRDSGYRIRVCTSIPTGGSTVPCLEAKITTRQRDAPLASDWASRRPTIPQTQPVFPLTLPSRNPCPL